MPKAVNRSCCHDKHNRPRRDSNLGPHTLQSDELTTLLLPPACLPIMHCSLAAFRFFSDCYFAYRIRLVSKFVAEDGYCKYSNE